MTLPIPASRVAVIALLALGACELYPPRELPPNQGTDQPSVPPGTVNSTPTGPNPTTPATMVTVTVTAPADTEIMLADAGGTWVRTETIGNTGQAELTDVPAGGFVSATWTYDNQVGLVEIDTVAGVADGDVIHFEGPEGWPISYPIATLKLSATDPVPDRFSAVRFDERCLPERLWTLPFEDEEIPMDEACLNQDGTVDLFGQAEVGLDGPQAVAWVTDLPVKNGVLDVTFDQWNHEPGVIEAIYEPDGNEPGSVSIAAVAQRQGSLPNRTIMYESSDPKGVLTAQQLTDSGYHDTAALELVGTDWVDGNSKAAVGAPLVLSSIAHGTMRRIRFDEPVPGKNEVLTRTLGPSDHPDIIVDPSIDFKAMTAEADWSGDACFGLDWDQVTLDVGVYDEVPWRWTITAAASSEISFPELDPTFTQAGTIDVTTVTSAEVLLLAQARQDESYDDLRGAADRHTWFEHGSRFADGQELCVSYVAAQYQLK